MATTVTLEESMVREIMVATQERTKAAAVRKALADYLRRQRLAELEALAANVEVLATNEELEAGEEC